MTRRRIVTSMRISIPEIVPTVLLLARVSESEKVTVDNLTGKHILWPSLSSFTETRGNRFLITTRGGFWLIGMADFAIDLKKEIPARLLLTRGQKEVATWSFMANKPLLAAGRDGLNKGLLFRLSVCPTY